MITLKEIKKANKFITYLIFENEIGRTISVPVPHDIGTLIETNINYLSSNIVTIPKDEFDKESK